MRRVQSGSRGRTGLMLRPSLIFRFLNPSAPVGLLAVPCEGAAKYGRTTWIGSEGLTNSTGAAQ